MECVERRGELLEETTSPAIIGVSKNEHRTTRTSLVIAANAKA